MAIATPRARIVRISLAVLLLWAVAVRVWLATEGLSANHYWDERYNVKNIRRVIAAGELEPISYYYTALSYLPQAALLAGSERIARIVDPSFAWFDERDLRPAGYLLCRLLQIGYGVGSIVLTFVIGRRLFSPAVGLIGALLLAVSPAHVRLSTFFKPDILLTFLVLVALLLALRAAAEPSWRRYAVAGAAVGLAMSSKLNGGPIALPIAVAGVAHGWRQPSRLLKLAAAAAASVVTFLILNPHLDRYLAALSRNQEIYAHHGESMGPLGRALRVASDTWGILLSPTFHGTIVGLIAAAGAVLLLAMVVRHRSDLERVLPWMMLLSFPLGYVAIYALATGYAKPNNFLPILPVTSLLAAWMVVESWTIVSARAAPLRSPWVVGLAAAAFAVAVAYPAQRWVYESRTRTTWDVAFDEVAAALKPWEGRVAYFEQVPAGMTSRPRPLRAMVRRPGYLDADAGEQLDQLDAAVFPAAADGAAAGPLTAERWRGVGGAEVREIRSRLFRTRGPAVVVALRPARLLSSQQVSASAEAGAAWTLPLGAPPEGGEVVSLGFSLPRAAPPPRLLRDRQAIDLAVTVMGRSNYYLSRRILRCPGAGPEPPLSLEFAVDPQARRTVDLTLYRWAADCEAGSIVSLARSDPSDADADREPERR